MQSFISVPFSFDHGFKQTHGVAKFSPAGMVLEYESKFMGLISSGLKDVNVPVEELLDVKFRKGVMKRGAKIEVRLKSMRRLSELPNQQGKIVLKVQTDDWERARDAADRMQAEITERTSSLPPPHPPLGSIFEDDTPDLNGIEIDE